MSLAAPTPPLLLTKRLTSFLQANLTPFVQTALLTTQSGKLLAHASSQPVGLLRSQCTVAASLWAIYTNPGAGATVSEALPPHSAPSLRRNSAATALTLQLTGAVVVLRLLRCGLLFMCIAPSHNSSNNNNIIINSDNPDPNKTASALHSQQSTNVNPTPTVGSPSEVESVVSAGAATTASITTTGSVTASGVVIMRRHAEDLARWLDDKLGSLGIPDESATFDIR